MTEENVDEVRLLDFKSIQEMLNEGVIQTLIGYTKEGQMVVAAPDVADLSEAKGEYPPPQSNQVLFGYAGACCSHNLRHRPIWTSRGWLCQELKTKCLPVDPSCGVCTHV